MYRIFVFLFCVVFCSQFLNAQSSQQLSSPDGRLQFTFNLTAEGALNYSISYEQTPIVLTSVMGLSAWEKGFIVSDVSKFKKDTVWKAVYGERSLIKDHYDEMIITMMHNKDERTKFQVMVRAYNEGIAFRYIIPEHPQGGMDISIQKELTEFTVPEGTKAWFTNRAQGEYRLLPMSNWPGESERPLVLQLPD